ncbi:hypothetical protein [uncultured Sphingomonas sp.]|uniref:hypothetical protein n=1 Tax=uncultured Sphingomonas sp. TaxID=158754 RepID=UPI0035CA501B
MALLVMIGRSPGYLWRFVNDGIPRALSERDHGQLPDFFGQPLGHRGLWLHAPAEASLPSLHRERSRRAN